jgi:hypothetical protein
MYKIHSLFKVLQTSNKKNALIKTWIQKPVSSSNYHRWILTFDEACLNKSDAFSFPIVQLLMIFYQIKMSAYLCF